MISFRSFLSVAITLLLIELSSYLIIGINYSGDTSYKDHFYQKLGTYKLYKKLVSGQNLNSNDLMNYNGLYEPIKEKYILSWEHLRSFNRVLAEGGWLLAGDTKSDIQADQRMIHNSYFGDNEEFYVKDSISRAKMALTPNLNGEYMTINGLYHHQWLQVTAWRNGIFKKSENDKKPLKNFYSNYTFGISKFNADEFGRRVTKTKNSKNKKKTIVVGDSIVFGANVDDDQTVVQYLQNYDNDSEYLNSGIPSSQIDDNLFRLNYELNVNKNIKNIIFFVFDNDYTSDSMNTGATLSPNLIINGLKAIIQKYNIEPFVVIHVASYISCPDVARRDARYFEKYNKLTNELITLLGKNNINYLNTNDLINDYRKKKNNIWSCYNFYSDHSHLSSFGNKYIANEIIKRIK